MARTGTVWFLMVVFLAFSVEYVRAQWAPSMLRSSPALSSEHSNRLLLNTDITGSFKNNEYFSPVSVGQTIPNVSGTLALGYQLSDKFYAALGVYAIKYSGSRVLTHPQAYAQLHYAVTPGFHIVMGNFYGGANHRLIEPLYQWERQLTTYPESGLQFVLDTTNWFVDVWVDWEHFIHRGDTIQERLNFGLSVSRELMEEDSRFGLSIPFQLLIHHRGGQMIDTDARMVVLGDLATGLCSRLNVDNGFVRSVGLDVYVAGYWDRYANKELRPYAKGWGIYPALRVDLSRIAFMAGYWHAERFYAFVGESLFGSFNPYRPQQQLPTRNLLTGKFAFENRLLKGVSMCAQVEIYGDLDRRMIDYSFGLHLRWNQLFSLKKF